MVDLEKSLWDEVKRFVRTFESHINQPAERSSIASRVITLMELVEKQKVEKESK